MKLKARRPFGLKFEIFDPEDGSLLGGGSNRALVSKNASAGIKRATTTDPAALSLGAVREGGIEGKYRVSIFQGNQPLTHESFRSKKNAIAYAVDWKERKRRNIYGFSAKLRLREFALGAGTRIRHIPMGERKSIAERLRKLIGGEAPALSGKVPPRMIRRDGEDLILHYRGNSNQRALKRPRYRHRTNEAMASWDSEGQWVTPRMNAKEKQGFLREAVGKRDREDWALVNTIGTSTNPQVAQHFRNNYKGGHFGVYATPISKIPDRIRDGKIGFPSRVYWEQEISQPNGGNLIKVRQYKTIGKTDSGWSISRRIRDFSAKLRLRELARGEYLRRLIGYLDRFLKGGRPRRSGTRGNCDIIPYEKK